MKRTILLCTLFLVLMQDMTWSQIPKTMSNQGVLKDASGALVADGDYSLTFNIYDVATGGTTLWSETQSSVSVVNGVFSVILGSITTLDLNFDKQYWLGVKIESDTELSPRIQLTASPYSLNAKSVTGSSNVFPADGNVGIGTTQPEARLDIEGGAYLGYETIISDYGGILKSGFYEDGGAAIAGDIPDQDHPHSHLIAARHSNTDNNHQLQIAASLEVNDRLFFRKIAAGLESSNPEWNELATRGTNTFAGDQYFPGSGIWNTSGNVGIGTTSPEAKLHIRSEDANGIILKDANSGSYRASLFNYEQYGGVLNINDASDGSIKAKIRGYAYNGVQAHFTAGNVGLGTTNPAHLLEVYDGNISLGKRSDAASIRYVGIPGEDDVFSGTSAGGASIYFENTGGGSQAIGFKTHEQGFSYDTRMYIDKSGNVGIGTPNPQTQLHIADGQGTVPSLGNHYLLIQDNDVTTDWAGISVLGGNSGGAKISFGDESSVGSGEIWYNNSDDYMGFNTAGSERLRITSSGNVGIGTNSPGAQLHATGNWILGSASSLPAFGVTGWLTSGAGNLYEGGGETWAHHFSNYGGGDIASFGTSGGVGQQPDTKVVIKNDGNVGIGTTSPSYPLDVNGQALISSSSFPPLRSVRTTTATNDYGAALSLRRKTTGDMADGFGVLLGFELADNTESSSEIARIVALRSGADNKGTLTFETMGSAGISEAMRIDNSGNVGIGTTSPENKLHVELNTSGAEVVAAFRNAGTIGSTQARIQIQRGDDAGTGVTRGLTIFTTNGNSGLADYENRNLSFYTGSGATATEKMTITNAGNVGIGTTSPGNAKLLVSKSGTGNVPDANTIALFEKTGDPSVNIAGTSSAALKLYTGNRYDGGLSVDAGTRNLSFYAGGTGPYLTVTNAGNVGIGTTSPDATLQVNGTMKVFGAWTTKSNNTVYQAASDGFIVVQKSSEADGGHIQIYTDSNNPPNTRRIEEIASSSVPGSAMCPVRKNDYWIVVGGDDIYWMPLGN